MITASWLRWCPLNIQSKTETIKGKKYWSQWQMSHWVFLDRTTSHRMSNVKDKKLKIKEAHVFAYCMLVYLFSKMLQFSVAYFLIVVGHVSKHPKESSAMKFQNWGVLKVIFFLDRLLWVITQLIYPLIFFLPSDFG